MEKDNNLLVVQAVGYVRFGISYKHFAKGKIHLPIRLNYWPVSNKLIVLLPTPEAQHALMQFHGGYWDGNYRGAPACAPENTTSPLKMH